MPRYSSLFLLAFVLPGIARAKEPRFDIEVMAVLSRAGCNQGACHGNLNGKGGFKLSLRGEDADWDHAVLTRDMLGRRTNSLHPDESLILKKATAAIPHEGGRRFERSSPEYAILREWIAGGLQRARGEKLVGIDVSPREQVLVTPAQPQAIRVRSRWADGSTTDVTDLAVYETSNTDVALVEGTGSIRKLGDGETTIAVRFLSQQTTVRLAFVPARPEFRWSAPREINVIDREIFAKLRSLRSNPAPVCDDSTFLRRVHLDTIGALPTVEETSAFLADDRTDKRARLIDSLLQRPEFADFWALKWSDLLRNEEKVLDRKGVEVFHGWIRRSLAEGKPLNEFARELIAGRGSSYGQPAANYYRALRDPLTRAEATAQVFLGIRLQCARCHNHPFDRWTMGDYYGLAAFFPRVNYRIVENNRKDRFDKHEFDGEQIVWFDRESELKHPRTGLAVSPRTLGDAKFIATDQDRLQALADWVADPANPFFARTQANRIWAHLMGRGLVDPVDDFRITNPPTHPVLLDTLAAHFARNGFHLRELTRLILNSATYQLSWQPTTADDANFGRALVQRLDAEVLLDAVSHTLAVPLKFDGRPYGMRATRLPAPQQETRRGRAGDAERFMKTFGKPDRLLSCECERNDDITVPQVLMLLNGTMVTRMLEFPDNRIGRMLNAGRTDAEIVNELMLAGLCRPATPAEHAQVREYRLKMPDRRKALEDVAWALINSKEFMVRR